METPIPHPRWLYLPPLKDVSGSRLRLSFSQSLYKDQAETCRPHEARGASLGSFMSRVSLSGSTQEVTLVVFRW